MGDGGKELIWIWMSILYVVFYYLTDRRPNPKIAQSGSLTSGLSFPSFKNRSGRNSWGLLKTLGSCNIDLVKQENSRVEKIEDYGVWS